MSMKKETGRIYPSNFVLQIRTFPNNWNIYNETQMTYRLDSSGKFYTSNEDFDDDPEYLKTISKGDLDDIKMLLTMLDPESMPSGKLGDYVSDGNRKVIELTWGNIERQWDCDHEWGPYDGILGALTKKLIVLSKK
jgi:hypothetical protein